MIGGGVAAAFVRPVDSSTQCIQDAVVSFDMLEMMEDECEEDGTYVPGQANVSLRVCSTDLSNSSVN